MVYTLSRFVTFTLKPSKSDQGKCQTTLVVSFYAEIQQRLQLQETRGRGNPSVKIFSYKCEGIGVDVHDEVGF